MKLLFILIALLALAVIAVVFVTVQPFAGAGPIWRGPRADPRRLEWAVRSLSALGARGDQEGMARAADWLRNELTRAGLVVQEQPYSYRGGRYRNLLVQVGPRGDGRIVIGAHYDVHGPYAGADDNGSGTAALLELARLFKERPPARAVELAFYSNEEYGLAGSAEHARSAQGVRAMISLEMLGCFDQPQKFPFAALKLLYPERGDYIVVVGRLQDFALARALKRALRANGANARSINAPDAIPGVGDSDHASFWRQGAKAAMITDTAWYRNPRYHTARDTPDTLDYARMAAITDGVAAFASMFPR